MARFEIKEKFEVSPSDITFKKLMKEAPDELLNLVDVLILPSHGTNDSFYSGSLDTLDHLNNSGIKTDIYVNDEDYKELELRGADIWLGTFFVKNFVIPIFCGVITSYIYDKLKVKKDDKISLQFIVEKKDGTASMVAFNGKVEEVGKALDAVKKFSDED